MYQNGMVQTDAVLRVYQRVTGNVKGFYAYESYFAYTMNFRA